MFLPNTHRRAFRIISVAPSECSPTRFPDVADVSKWELNSAQGLSQTIEIWLERYIAQKYAQAVSPKTIKSYREAIVPFMTYSHQYESMMEIEDITAKFINNYLLCFLKRI